MKNRSKILSPRDSQIRRELSDSAEFAANGFSHIYSSAKSGLKKVASALSGVCTSTLKVLFPPSEISIQPRDSYSARLESISDVVKKTFPVPKPIQSDSGTMVPTPGRFELNDTNQPSKKQVIVESVEYKQPETGVKPQLGVPLWKNLVNKDRLIKSNLIVKELNKVEKPQDKKEEKKEEKKEVNEKDDQSSSKKKKLNEGVFFGKYTKEFRKKSPVKANDKELKGNEDCESQGTEIGEKKKNENGDSPRPKVNKVSESLREALGNTPEFHSHLPNLPETTEKNLMLKMTPECSNPNLGSAANDSKPKSSLGLEIKPPIDFSTLQSPNSKKDLSKDQPPQISDEKVKPFTNPFSSLSSEPKKPENPSNFPQTPNPESPSPTKTSDPKKTIPVPNNINPFNNPVPALAVSNTSQPLNPENQLNQVDTSNNPFLDSSNPNIKKPLYVFGTNSSNPPSEVLPTSGQNPFVPSTAPSNPFSQQTTSNPFSTTTAPTTSPFTSNSNTYSSTAIQIPNPFNTSTASNANPFSTATTAPNPTNLTTSPIHTSYPFAPQTAQPVISPFPPPSIISSSSYSNPFQQTLPNSGLSQASNPNPFSTNQFEQLKNASPPYPANINSNQITNSSINPFSSSSTTYQPNPYVSSTNPYNNPVSSYASSNISASFPQHPMETGNNMSVNNPFNPVNTVQNPFSSHSNSGQFGGSTGPSYNQGYSAPNPFAENLSSQFDNKDGLMETNNIPSAGINPRPDLYGSSYGAPSTQIGNGTFNIGHVPTRNLGRGGKKFVNYRNP